MAPAAAEALRARIAVDTVLAAGRWQLRGQILGPEEDGIVELSGAAPPIAAVINSWASSPFHRCRAGATP